MSLSLLPFPPKAYLEDRKGTGEPFPRQARLFLPMTELRLFKSCLAYRELVSMFLFK